jgi:hypothetical protein
MEKHLREDLLRLIITAVMVLVVTAVLQKSLKNNTEKFEQFFGFLTTTSDENTSLPQSPEALPTASALSE